MNLLWPRAGRLDQQRRQAGGRRYRPRPRPALPLFWALFLDPLLARSDQPIQLVCPLDNRDEGIVLLKRELRKEDVYVFHPEMPGYEWIEDLRREVPARRGSERGEEEQIAGSAPLASMLASNPLSG